MTASPEDDLIYRLAREHGVSPSAVEVVLQALRRGDGTMAQFSHVEFGGMAQWSPGMTMVGDMFNMKLSSKVDAIATSLSDYLRDPSEVERN